MKYGDKLVMLGSITVNIYGEYRQATGLYIDTYFIKVDPENDQFFYYCFKLKNGERAHRSELKNIVTINGEIFPS